jgi:hypothetical protein
MDVTQKTILNVNDLQYIKSASLSECLFTVRFWHIGLTGNQHLTVLSEVITTLKGNLCDPNAII